MAGAVTEMLLIHLGGLGDVCLSESTFFSLSRAFGERPVGLAYPRFLKLFGGYFKRIEDAGSAGWMHLFADSPENHGIAPWKRIVFIGKDRSGRLRQRWQYLSREPLLFIDMYPGEERPSVAGASEANNPDGSDRIEALHVEAFQLRQLSHHGIAPLRKPIVPVSARRIVLYPERGFSKRKWSVENFLALNEALTEKGVEVTILAPGELKGNLPNPMVIDDLGDVARFLSEGGIFVSNDCGVAHLAGALGMASVTIFHEYNPAIWHPRGRNVSLRVPEGGLSCTVIEEAVLGLLEGLSNP
jgi:ADP-heptose:LPS heptosyltransferase